jgi:hypothetical protein
MTLVAVYDGDFITNGCSCCSVTYGENDIDDILVELERTVEVVIDACKALDIDFDDFIATVKEMHK